MEEKKEIEFKKKKLGIVGGGERSRGKKKEEVKKRDVDWDEEIVIKGDIKNEMKKRKRVVIIKWRKNKRMLMKDDM